VVSWGVADILWCHRRWQQLQSMQLVTANNCKFSQNILNMMTNWDSTNTIRMPVASRRRSSTGWQLVVTLASTFNSFSAKMRFQVRMNIEIGKFNKPCLS
jgi:hypothetical protein